MKKLMLLVFTLFLAVSVNSQEKKTFEGAVAHAQLSKEEAAKVVAIKDEKTTAIKAIKKQKLDKTTETEKIKVIRQESAKKTKAAIGKEKYKAMSSYWKKK